MNPILLDLDKKYLSEQLDYYHRKIEVSDRLWKTYISDNNQSKPTSFTTYTQQKPPKNNNECVKYLNQLEKHSNIIGFINGKCHINGYELSCNKDYRRKKIPFAFVITQEQEIYAIPHNPKADSGSFNINHTSLSAGQPVYGAGEMFIEEGNITSINNISGHYKPGLEHFIYSLKLLKDKGANLNRTKAKFVYCFGFDEKYHSYKSAANFLEVYLDGFTNDYRGETNSIEDAIASLTNDPESTCMKAVFMIRDSYDLFLFTRNVTNNWDHKSFNEFYKKKLENISQYDESNPNSVDQRPGSFRRMTSFDSTNQFETAPVGNTENAEAYLTIMDATQQESLVTPPSSPVKRFKLGL